MLAPGPSHKQMLGTSFEAVLTLWTHCSYHVDCVHCRGRGSVLMQIVGRVPRSLPNYRLTLWFGRSLFCKFQLCSTLTILLKQLNLYISQKLAMYNNMMLLMVIVYVHKLSLQARIFCGNFNKINKNMQWKRVNRCVFTSKNNPQSQASCYSNVKYVSQG